MTNKSGVGYFIEGLNLITTKGLKRFVFVPLVVNLLLFSTAFYYLYQEIGIGINYLVNILPDWLSWIKEALAFILWPIAVISVLLIFAILFGTLANVIASPFNSLLAEKVERHLTGQSLGDEGLIAVFKDIPRVIGREITKLTYYIPRAIGFLLLFFILPVVGQVLWFLFNAWMMAIQYCDYPYDNHKVPFKFMRQQLYSRKGVSITFGATVSLVSLIPVINFMVMPVAVCGATAMWVKEFRQEAIER